MELMFQFSDKSRWGRVRRGIRRVFLVHPAATISTTELMQWTHALQLYRGRASRCERQNFSRAILIAAPALGLVRAGRSKKGSGAPILWRLKPSN